jgi:hypothetical protein
MTGAAGAIGLCFISFVFGFGFGMVVKLLREGGSAWLR